MQDIDNYKNDSIDTFLDGIYTKDLEQELENLYKIIGNEEMIKEHQSRVQLSKIQNKNYNDYKNIDVFKLKDMPEIFDEKISDILSLYNTLEPSYILNSNLIESEEITKLIKEINNRILILDNAVSTYLKQITKSNDELQNKYSIEYINNLNIDSKEKENLKLKYNDIIVYNSYITMDNYENVKRQEVRKNKLNELLKLLNISNEKIYNASKLDKLDSINKKIDIEISKIKEKIEYLEDLMPEDSKHLKEFSNFKDFCNRLIAYDDTNYDNAYQTYEILKDEDKFKKFIISFENLFIEEIHNNNIEQKFIYEKVGIKNLVKTIEYINDNYIQYLDEIDKSILDGISYEIGEEDYDVDEFNKLITPIIKKIWNHDITNITSYTYDSDYAFICSNNGFIDEKYQTILLTKKMVEKSTDYKDYQIGFICEYNDNILYITENDDIMSVDGDDMSNLKTPYQLECEFLNYKISNRIALNGYKTKLIGVYIIDDNDLIKNRKAIELANTYKLPLIKLKK
ncbi:MAG: hypothetical protein Q4E75_03155 [bacterium]|nr:hypothetical protein [bacterium]